jgi:hypothetical protein
MRSRSDLRRVIFVNYYVIANSFLLCIFSANLFLGSLLLLVFVHIVNETNFCKKAQKTLQKDDESISNCGTLMNNWKNTRLRTSRGTRSRSTSSQTRRKRLMNRALAKGVSLS